MDNIHVTMYDDTSTAFDVKSLQLIYADNFSLYADTCTSTSYSETSTLHGDTYMLIL